MKTIRLSYDDTNALLKIISDELVMDQGNEALLRIKNAIKADYKRIPTIHETVRQYEVGCMTAPEMVTRIILLAGVDDCDIRQD